MCCSRSGSKLNRAVTEWDNRLPVQIASLHAVLSLNRNRGGSCCSQIIRTASATRDCGGCAPPPYASLRFPILEPLLRDLTSALFSPEPQCGPSSLRIPATGHRKPPWLDGAPWLPDTNQRSPRPPSTVPWVTDALPSVKMAAQRTEVGMMQCLGRVEMDVLGLEAALRLAPEGVPRWHRHLAGPEASVRSSRA